MMKRTIIIFFSLLFVFLLLPGCDAPRDHNGNIVDIQEDNPTQIDSFKVLVKHYPPPDPFVPDDYFCYMEALISDLDGVDHVHLEIKDSLRINVDYSPESELCTYSFLPSNFDYNISSFEGQPFYLYVFDELGYVTKSEKQSIVRILRYTPTLISPGQVSAPGDTTETRPLLVWTQYESQYDITYSVEIYASLNTTRLLRIDGIPRDINGTDDTVDSVRVSTDLPWAQNYWYYWTLTVIDNMGNETTSDKLYFVAIP